MVETQLCKLRDTYDTLIGRACKYICIYVLFFIIPERDQKKSVTAGLYEDPDRLVVV